jgi:uncharacterized protein YqeY
VSGNTSLREPIMIENTLASSAKLTMKNKDKRRITGVNELESSSSDEEED